MLKSLLKFVGILAFIVLCGLVGCAQENSAPVVPENNYQVSTTKPYDEVLAELASAISDANFSVVAHNRVGKAIRERDTPDFPEYDIVQFCNLTLAKKLLQKAPHAVEYMPCKVLVYQYAGKTLVKTHLLPTDDADPEIREFMVKMNKTLKHIIDTAAQP